MPHCLSSEARGHCVNMPASALGARTCAPLCPRPMARIRSTRLPYLSRCALACATLLTLAATPIAHAKKPKAQVAHATFAATAAQKRQAARNPAGLPANVALAFARTRKGLEGGDLARGNHQMEIIKAVVDKATSGTTIINNYTAIMESLEGLFVMNVPQPLISALVKDQLANMTGWNIVSYSTYGTGGYGEVYSVPGTTVYIIEPDVAAVEKAAKMIDMVMDGETMTEEKMNAI